MGLQNHLDFEMWVGEPPNRVPHLRDSFIVAKVGEAAQLLATTTKPIHPQTSGSHRARYWNKYLPTDVYRSTAEKPPRRISITESLTTQPKAKLINLNL